MTITWKRERRGEYAAETPNGQLYISRTRYGWAYGIDGIEVDETTRPLARAKVLAERLGCEGRVEGIRYSVTDTDRGWIVSDAGKAAGPYRTRGEALSAALALAREDELRGGE